MSSILCPNIDAKKEYIIPTKSWLEMVKKLDLGDDMNTNGIIYIGKLIDKGNIVVKISKKDKEGSELAKKINENLFNFPNIVKTHCTFECKENISLIEKNKQFCNKSDKSIKNTFELMKKYENSISSVTIPTIEIYLSAILQLSFAQMNIYSKYGYTHNDMHRGNILIHNLKNPVVLKYKYVGMNYFDSNELTVNLEFIITDFDRMIVFDFKYLKNDDIYDEEKELSSLYNNINTTIKTIGSRLDKSIGKKINQFYDNYQYKNDENMSKAYNKILKKCIKDNNEKQFRSEIIKLSEKYIYDYYNKIKNVFKQS